MTKPLVSIIIVNWNTKSLLRNCLKSVISGTDISHEIIVVDNDSSDGSQEMVSKDFREVKLVETNKNLGMGTGNNRGLAIAKGEYLLVLNTDTIVTKNAIATIVKWLDNHPKAGVVGPQLRFANGRIQTSGGNFPTLLNTTVLFLGIDDLPFVGNLLPLYQREDQFLSGKQKDRDQTEHQVDWLAGACLLLRKDVFVKTKGFDEKIFMYGEEVEWFYRVKKFGYQVWYTPSAWITHFKGGSSTTGSEQAILGEMKGLTYFFSKHKPLWQLFIVRLVLKVGSLGRIVLFSLLKRPDLVPIYKHALTL